MSTGPELTADTARLPVRLRAIAAATDDLRRILSDERISPCLPSHELDALRAAEGRLTGIVSAHNDGTLRAEGSHAPDGGTTS